MYRMMAAPNGYSSDCGAPGGQPYKYQFARTNEEEGSSDLSFLYDRAQGNTYGPQQQGVATTQFSPADRYSSPESINHQSNYSTPSSEYNSSSSDLGQGLARATPAPAYPYSPKRDVFATAGQPNGESLACPTGSYAGTQQGLSSPSQFNHRSNVDTRESQVAALNTEQQRGPEALERQMSNLRVSNPNQPGSVTPSSAGHEVTQSQGPRPRLLLRTDPPSVPPASPATGPRTLDRRPQKLSVGHCNSPPTSNTIDPRRNYIRQNIPWRDINAARKFSVPILNRPRIQVFDQASSDDQMVSAADPSQPRSSRQAPGEVDKSSVRQLLREGDEIGDYEQKSIRYTGRTNPSKAFRLLQSATGSSDSESIEHHQNERRMRRRQKREEMLSAAAEDKDALKDADDVVDISYVGSKIPSRTFRFLQEAIGARDQQAGHVSSPSPSVYHDYADSPFDEQPARTVKVIHLRPQKSLENLIGDF